MNIEKTISEHAVSDILTPMLESQDRIVTEDVAPLFDQATGLDTPSASGTVTTTIEESRSVITAIIRKAWTATLTMLGGASVISYIAAAYTYLRNRLQGNETYGIPDRRSEISASSPLAANLALLNDRKISGVPEAADGISLVHLLFNSGTAAEITELTDDNEYVCNKTFDCNNPMFQNLEKMTIGCTENTAYIFTMNGYGSQMPTLKELHFPKMVIGRTLINNTGVSGWFHPGFANLEVITFDVLQEIKRPSYVPSYAYAFISRTMPSVKKIEFPELVTLNDFLFGGAAFTALEEMRMPKLTNANYAFFNGYAGGDGCPNLILIEVGAVQTNLNISFWNPTNVLADQDNLQQFLQNFRSYIALRLTDNGSGKTLTLSQAVRNAIHAAESTYGIENIIITQKGWTISPAPN